MLEQADGMIDVFGPIKTFSGVSFAVKRSFKNRGTKKAFNLKFEIKYDERSNKWRHTSIGKRSASLCLERLYKPKLDCACIRACKEKLRSKIGEQKSKRKGE